MTNLAVEPLTRAAFLPFGEVLAREGAEIVAAPGNPGIAALGRCVPVGATDVDALVALAETERPAFTLVGPEAPLALGVVDRFRARAFLIGTSTG